MQVNVKQQVGQGAFSPAPGLPLCVVDFHVVRRCSRSLVAGAGLASGGWGRGPAGEAGGGEHRFVKSL